VVVVGILLFRTRSEASLEVGTVWGTFRQHIK